MDWDAAIETNRAALKRVLAALIAMAGFEHPLWPAGHLPLKGGEPLASLFRAASTAPSSGCCARPNRPRGGW